MRPGTANMTAAFWKTWCVFVHASLHMRREKNQLDATEWFIVLIICSTCFRALLCPSSGARDYMCYYHLWCAMPWLLVVGGQMQGSRLCVRNEGFCSSNGVCECLLPSRGSESNRRIWSNGGTVGSRVKPKKHWIKPAVLVTSITMNRTVSCLGLNSKIPRGKPHLSVGAFELSGLNN